MYPQKIMGHDIVLKTLSATEENADLVYHLVQKNKDYLSMFFDKLVLAFSDKKRSLQILKFDEEQRSCQKALNYYVFVDDKIIGEIAADWSSKERSTSIVYWLDKSQSGKGYISRSLKLMEYILFAAKHQEIRLYIDVTNLRSADVAMRAGYQLSEDTNYYFKTYQMYCENYKSLCRQMPYSKRYFEKNKEFFR